MHATSSFKQEQATSLVAIEEHFLRIARFLYTDATIDPNDGERDHYKAELFWGAVASTLEIGGSIESVGVSPGALNPESGLMCSTAWRYDVARGEITAAYLTELTRFMWSWIALERLCDLLCAKTQGRNRTEKIINFIKVDRTVARDTVIYLTSELWRLADSTVCQRADHAIKRTGDFQFAHVHLCREARNDLFHAHSMELEPVDEDDSEEGYSVFEDDRVILPKTLCRLSLLIIQNMLFVHLKPTKFLTGQLMRQPGIPEGLPLPNAISGLHVGDYISNRNQLELFGDIHL